MTGKVFLGGHSLGAARVLQYAYSRIERGLPVDGVYALAPPNPGNRVIGSGLNGVFMRSVKNRRDLVTDVPVDIAILGEEYVQPRAFEEINEASDDTGPFRDHHIALYQAGCKKLVQGTAAIDIGIAVDWVARLYETADGWDWINPIDGQYWSMIIMANGAKLMIARGSKTPLDWLDDFDAHQIDVLGACMSAGFWSGIGPIEAMLDAQLA